MIQMPPLGGIFLCNRGVMTLAATRLIALHKNKGKSVAACLKSRTDYAQNPDKTNKGELVSSYECSPLTADEEFMLSKRQYELMTGRRQKNDVIAYQIRQSFKPGEITAEEANKVGYELAMRFTKGKYAFIVATHTDREHIHNHIIYNSTALDSTRKFRDFLLSGLAVQRLSDLICLEHQLSVIEIKPYRERQKRTLYPPKESNRDKLCSVIDGILLDEKTANFEAFLQKLEQQGYEIKRGKHTSVKGARQKRFIRFRTLGAGYSEDEIKAVIAGEAEHCPHQKQPPKEQPFHLLVDIQARLSEGKSEGYARWAKRYNLKEMSKTLIFLQENKIGSIEEMQERVDAATAHYHELGDSIKASEKRLAEIAVLKAHIINYAKTRPVYDAYRKSGYSKKFLEAHREQITLHKAAKAAFDEASLKKLPKVKELDAEYATLLSQKKAAYPAYRKARDEMQELKKAQKNVELFRFRTLGAGYSEDEIKAVIAGEAEHCPHQKQPPKEQPFHLLVDIQARLSEGKSEGYARWAKRYNLKEMSKTLIFLQENKIGSIEEMQERVDAATAHYHELGDSIKASEKRLAEIAVLKAHIINYAKTRPVYDAYRKSGYSKKFLEAHREQITLHKAAKAAFDEASLKKLPKVKELDAEYAALLSQKKATYPAYRKARDEMQELKKAQKNVELFFAEEKDPKEKSQTR